MARSVPEFIFDMPQIKIEHVIAEIIDNSLDAEASNIELRLLRSGSEGIGFSVCDDGRGFDSIEDLFLAFEISEIDKKRKEADIGNFHIGMKIATLSFFNQISLITEIEGDYHLVKATRPQFSNQAYDMDIGNNPSSPILFDEELESISEITSAVRRMKEKGYKTCFIAINSCKKALKEGRTDQAWAFEKKFVEHLNTYFGMTYQLYLEQENPPSIKIIKDGDQKTLNGEEQFTCVNPIDPFWTSLTPKAMLEVRRKLDEDKKNSETQEKEEIDSKIAFIDGMSKFGVFEGHKSISELDGEQLKITPYVMPEKNAKSKFSAVLSDQKWFDGDTAYLKGTVQNSGSTLLLSDNLCGFFFYRGMRLITYGKFYALDISSHDANNVRIKVEYPVGKLDKKIKLHPNKSHFISIHSEVYESAIYPALETKSGGDQYAQPFAERMPFWEKEQIDTKKKKHTTKPTTIFDYQKKRGSTKKGGITYIICNRCGFLHEKEDRCPRIPCEKCGKYELGCTDITCNYECKLCGLRGHSEDNCPELCPLCGKHHPGERCENLCKVCNEDPCVCDCERCGKATKECDCCKTCNNTYNNCVCGQSDSQWEWTEKGRVATIMLYKKNREENIRIIQEVKDKLGLGGPE